VLSTNPSLHEGNFAEFHRRGVLALAGTGAHLFIIEPDFSVPLSTRRPFDSPPTQTADSQSAQRAFDTGAVVVTDLVFGFSSHEWVYNILMPIDLGPLGRKIVALNQSASNFDDTLLEHRLPEGWATALIDKDGLIVAATAG